MKGNKPFVNRAPPGSRQLILKSLEPTCAAFYSVGFMGFLQAVQSRERVKLSSLEAHPKNISNTRSTLFNKYSNGRVISHSIAFFYMNSLSYFTAVDSRF